MMDGICLMTFCVCDWILIGGATRRRLEGAQSHELGDTEGT